MRWPSALAATTILRDREMTRHLPRESLPGLSADRRAELQTYPDYTAFLASSTPKNSGKFYEIAHFS